MLDTKAIQGTAMQPTPLQIEAHRAHLARRGRLWTRGVPQITHVEAEQAAPANAVPWGAPVNLLTLPSPQVIIRLVALKHGRKRVEVIGPSRARDIVAVRHEAVGIVFTHCHGFSLPDIGRMFGDRDHTTILSALRKLGLAKRYPAIRNRPKIRRMN